MSQAQAGSAQAPVADLGGYREFCDGRLADPYPMLARLRSEEPVHWSELLGAWVLTRYDDVLASILDRRLASDRVAVNMAAIAPGLVDRYEPLREHVSNWLGFSDPPRHTRMRQLLSGTVNARLSLALAARIGEIVDELLEKIAGGESTDLVGDYALTLPSRIICEILGVPPSSLEQFRSSCDDLVAFVGNVGPTVAASAERALESERALETFFVELAAQRRDRPADDLSGTLAAALADGSLSRPEYVGLCVFVYVAGFETTVSLIGNGLLLLLEHPEQAAIVRAGSERLAAALEEMLRYESPIQLNTRLALADIELRGRRIKAGEAVVLHLGAANRDPERFEQPDRFDVTRRGARHLSFGWASHSCLGAPLARAEAAIALGRLLERFPAFPNGVRVAGEWPSWRPGMTLRALRTLHVSGLSGR